MAEPFLLAWDLGTQRNGWAAGPADRLPSVGAFRLTRIIDQGDQIGLMGSEFTDAVLAVHRRFPEATHWVSERPLLITTASKNRAPDDRFKVERLMGLSCLLQTMGVRLGKICRCVEPGTAKMDFAGRNATKDQMVAMAMALGIPLPERDVDGREDVADAVAVFKCGVRLFARKHLNLWDGAIYRRRGGLL